MSKIVCWVVWAIADGIITIPPSRAEKTLKIYKNNSQIQNDSSNERRFPALGCLTEVIPLAMSQAS